jgi:hydroxyacylglutathione hydrolase
MDVTSAHENIDNFQLLDVREQWEWDEGHLEGSVHIPLQELPTRLGELDPGKPLLAICHVGQRSALAAQFLGRNGFDAHNLEGGVAEWAQKGLPLVV